MTPVAILGVASAPPDYIVSGPWPNLVTADNNVTTWEFGYVSSWMPFTDQSATPRRIWTNDSPGGGGAETENFIKGIHCRSITTAGPGRVNVTMGGLNMMPITDGSDLPPNYVNPSWRRVARLSWSFAMSAGAALTSQTGICFCAQNGVLLGNIQWPIAPSINFLGGFGVFGDGAGGWDFISFGAGPPTAPVVETVSLNAALADPEDWNSFDALMISATDTRPAEFQLWVNDQLMLTRNWGTAPLLFPLVPLVAVGSDAFQFTPVFQCGPVGGTLHMGDWTYQMGRYDKVGREFTS